MTFFIPKIFAVNATKLRTRRKTSKMGGFRPPILDTHFQVALTSEGRFLSLSSEGRWRKDDDDDDDDDEEKEASQ